MTEKNEKQEIDYENPSNELMQIISQWEGFNDEKKEVNDRFKEFKKEVKNSGYDTKIVNKIVKLRARNPDDIAEEEALTETYKREIGMS